MSKIKTMIVALGMIVGGSAFASKLCVNSTVHELVVEVNKVFSGDANRYFEVMSTLGHPADQQGANRVLAGKGFQCNVKSHCVGIVMAIRPTAMMPIFDVKAFCRAPAKGESRANKKGTK